jgi:ABC-type Na+ efflux pump permease subunit
MIVPPVIVRELRIALRKNHAVKSRFYMAAWGAGGVSLLLFLGWLGGTSFWGSLLHQGLFYFGLWLAVVPAISMSVGLFCEERRNQTLELLYLTGMGPGEFFAGKLLGGLLVASAELLALTPFLAVPFLSGGLSLDLYWATITCFPVLLAFTVGTGVLASVLSREEGTALVMAVMLGGAACLVTPLPYVVGIAVAGVPPFSARWLCLSPAYGPYLVAREFGRVGPSAFWMTSGLTLLWALVNLGLAALLLRRNWKKEIARTASSGWRGKWNAWLRGSAPARAALRERILPVNPFQWLAEQDRQPVLLAWALISGVVLVWLLGWCAWPRAWPSPVNFYLTALLLVLGTSLTAAYTGARQMARERQQGTLELLLTTPLQPAEIVHGQVAAVRAQFRSVRWTVAALCVLMMAGGFLTRGWTERAVISYLLIWGFFLGWCFYQARETVPRAMWMALNTGRPTSAVFRNQQGWWWFSMLFNGRNLWGGLVHARNFPSGSRVELTVVICISVFLALLAIAFEYVDPDIERSLIKDMRVIAREPIPDRNDPRLKKWKGTGRLSDA